MNTYGEYLVYVIGLKDFEGKVIGFQKCHEKYFLDEDEAVRYLGLLRAVHPEIYKSYRVQKAHISLVIEEDKNEDD